MTREYHFKKHLTSRSTLHRSTWKCIVEVILDTATCYFNVSTRDRLKTVIFTVIRSELLVSRSNIMYILRESLNHSRSKSIKNDTMIKTIPEQTQITIHYVHNFCGSFLSHFSHCLIGTCSTVTSFLVI